MAVHDDLGMRMKGFYEQIPKTRLMRRCPVVLRIDGKAFHTYTKGMRKPFDLVLMQSMQETMKYLCENIQGCVFGYTQSDEISLVLLDYQTFETEAWFDYEIQKMCSISASMATLAFNKLFEKNADAEIDSLLEAWNRKEEDEKYVQVLYKVIEKGAMFDARCFNIPKEEVTNLIYWRQLDAIRNSIQMVGQANFSVKQLHGKSCNMIKEMLISEIGLDWESFSIACKRGTACYKDPEAGWVVDYTMPLLKGSDREYVDKWIFIGEGMD